MGAIETIITADLPEPGEDMLAQARQAGKTPAAHAAFVERIAALHEIEVAPPERQMAFRQPFTLAAFNAERLTDPAATRVMIARAGADAVLLSEVDCGMARSGNGHPLRALVSDEGEGYAFGVEFVELDLGDPIETRLHRGKRNGKSLHGNALATRFALTDHQRIPLDKGGEWFAGHEGVQHRIGGRMALAARVVEAPHPLWFVTLHLESRTDAEDRAAQMGRLLAALAGIAPGAAIVIGGDCNTKDLPRGRDHRKLVLDAPERFEPLFHLLRDAGFSWAAANTAEPTQRRGPTGKGAPPFARLDWIFTRGLVATNPRVIPAVSGNASPVSDHEMVAVDLMFEETTSVSAARGQITL